MTRLIDIADYISVDDLKMTPVGLLSLSTFVKGQFARPDRDPDDAEDKFTFERLGGVLFLQPEGNNDEAIDYRVDFLENPGGITCVRAPCPQPFSTLFQRCVMGAGHGERRYSPECRRKSIRFLTNNAAVFSYQNPVEVKSV